MQRVSIFSLASLIFFSLSIPVYAQEIGLSPIMTTIAKGDSLRRIGNYDQSLQSYLSLYPEIASLPDSSSEAAEFYQGLTLVFNDFGAKEMSLKYAKQAYRCLKKAESTQIVYQKLGQIGSFYLNMAQYDSAEAYFQKGLHILKETDQYPYIAGAYNNLGIVKFKMQSPDAKNYYDTALFLIQKHHIEERGIFASVNDNLAEVYIAEKDYQRALAYCKNIEDWLINHKNEQKRAISLSLKKAVCLWKIGNAEAALKELSKLDTVFTKPDFFEMQQQFYLLHTQIYKERKQYDLASLYQDKLIQAIQENLKKREEFTYKAVDSISEIRFKLSQKELAYVQLEKSNYKKTMFSILFFASIMFFMGYLFYRRRINWQKKEFSLLQEQKEIALQNMELQRENSEISLAKEIIAHENAEMLLKTAQLEKENIAITLDYRKKEIANMVNYLADGHEWNENLLQSLTKIANLKENEKAKPLQEIIMQIRNRMFVDEKINIVHENMNILNQEFYAKMREKYPDISLTELEICAYFRMNLSNKDIAALRNTTYNAVKKIRYRIRKKLHIEKDEDIHTFLHAL